MPCDGTETGTLLVETCVGAVFGTQLDEEGFVTVLTVPPDELDALTAELLDDCFDEDVLTFTLSGFDEDELDPDELSTAGAEANGMELLSSDVLAGAIAAAGRCAAVRTMAATPITSTAAAVPVMAFPFLEENTFRTFSTKPFIIGSFQPEALPVFLT